MGFMSTEKNNSYEFSGNSLRPLEHSSFRSRCATGGRWLSFLYMTLPQRRMVVSFTRTSLKDEPPRPELRCRREMKLSRLVWAIRPGIRVTKLVSIFALGGGSPRELKA